MAMDLKKRLMPEKYGLGVNPPKVDNPTFAMETQQPPVAAQPAEEPAPEQPDEIDAAFAEQKRREEFSQELAKRAMDRGPSPEDYAEEGRRKYASAAGKGLLTFLEQAGTSTAGRPNLQGYKEQLTDQDDIGKQVIASKNAAANRMNELSERVAREAKQPVQGLSDQMTLKDKLFAGQKNREEYEAKKKEAAELNNPIASEERAIIESFLSADPRYKNLKLPAGVTRKQLQSSPLWKGIADEAFKAQKTPTDSTKYMQIDQGNQIAVYDPAQQRIVGTFPKSQAPGTARGGKPEYRTNPMTGRVEEIITQEDGTKVFRPIEGQDFGNTPTPEKPALTPKQVKIRADVIKEYEKDPVVQTATEADNALRTFRESVALAKQGNGRAFQAAITQLVKISGDRGQLSDTDRKAFAMSAEVEQKFKDKLNLLWNGTPGPESIKQLEDIANRYAETNKAAREGRVSTYQKKMKLQNVPDYAIEEALGAGPGSAPQGSDDKMVVEYTVKGEDGKPVKKRSRLPREQWTEFQKDFPGAVEIKKK